jgi:hypothetical protein
MDEETQVVTPRPDRGNPIGSSVGLAKKLFHDDDDDDDDEYEFVG